MCCIEPENVLSMFYRPIWSINVTTIERGEKQETDKLGAKEKEKEKKKDNKHKQTEKGEPQQNGLEWDEEQKNKSLLSIIAQLHHEVEEIDKMKESDTDSDQEMHDLVHGKDKDTTTTTTTTANTASIAFVKYSKYVLNLPEYPSTGRLVAHLKHLFCYSILHKMDNSTVTNVRLFLSTSSY